MSLVGKAIHRAKCDGLRINHHAFNLRREGVQEKRYAAPAECTS
jgi:hypothetical protein